MPHHDDPFLRRWALDATADASMVTPERQRAIFDAVLPDSVVRDLLMGDDQDDILRLVDGLPDERWPALADVLVERWPDWTGWLAGRTAPLIARHRPRDAMVLFERFVAQAPSRDEDNVVKRSGVAEAIPHLKEEGDRDRALALVTAIAGTAKDRKAAMRDLLVATTAKAALAIGHRDRVPLISAWLDLVFDGDFLFFFNVSMHVVKRLLGTGSAVELALAIVNGDAEQAVSPLAGTVFRADPLLTDFDEAVAALARDDTGPAARLIDARLSNPPGDARPEGWDDFAALMKARLPGRKGASRGRPWTEAVAVGGLLTTLLNPAIDLGQADLDTIWTVVSADLELPPGLESALRPLAEAPREEVVARLTGIAGDSYAGVHAATLMGRLGYDEFLPVLIEGLDWKFHKAYDAATAALERFGDRAVAALDERFEESAPIARMAFLVFATRSGTEAAIAFIAKHFAYFADEEPEILAEAVTTLNAEPLNALLAARADRVEADLRRALAVVAKLNGREDAPDLRDVVAREVRREAREADREAATLRDGVGAFRRQTLDLPLTCRACGRTDSYAVAKVQITDDPAALKPFLAEDIPCSACGAVSEFDFTPAAEATIVDEADRFRMPGEGGRLFPPYGSPLELGSPADVLRALEESLAANPDNAAGHRAAAGLYRMSNRNEAAERHFRRCLEIDPTRVDAYFFLADGAHRRGDRTTALDLLERGAAHGKALPCRRAIDWDTPAGFVADYIALHTELARHDPGRPKLLPAQFTTKLGRNDPCPLGTGKKVKKCCGGGT